MLAHVVVNTTTIRSRPRTLSDITACEIMIWMFLNIMQQLLEFQNLQHKLPEEVGRWRNISRENRVRQLCHGSHFGDEFRYITGMLQAVFVWQLDIQLPVQSVPITTKVVSSNSVHGEVYSIQHYVIKWSMFLFGTLVHQYTTVVNYVRGIRVDVFQGDTYPPLTRQGRKKTFLTPPPWFLKNLEKAENVNIEGKTSLVNYQI